MMKKQRPRKLPSAVLYPLEGGIQVKNKARGLSWINQTFFSMYE